MTSRAVGDEKMSRFTTEGAASEAVRKTEDGSYARRALQNFMELPVNFLLSSFFARASLERTGARSALHKFASYCTHCYEPLFCFSLTNRKALFNFAFALHLAVRRSFNLLCRSALEHCRHFGSSNPSLHTY